jgi:predicted  nucleic acid-binding Zn-ribbon protein
MQKIKNEKDKLSQELSVMRERMKGMEEKLFNRIQRELRLRKTNSGEVN